MEHFQPSEVKIGLLGGGQLGKMIIQEAINYNLNISILDPDKHAPCKHLVKEFVCGSFSDYQTVYDFGKDKHIVTIEIENVNTEALFDLEKIGVKVFPQPQVIETCKDKGLQKIFFQNNELPTSDFFLIDSKNQISKYKDFFPFFQKLRVGGYDGKGVVKLTSVEKIEHAFDAPSVLEMQVEVLKEVSVIVNRNESGEVKCFPTVQCVFNPQAHLVDYLFSPSDLKSNKEQELKTLSIKIAQALNIVGTLAIEYFIKKDGTILINEMAPRVHNSGHQTIEANYVSQFEQHLRSILNMPLGDTSIVKPAVMLNVIGSENAEGPAKYDGMSNLTKYKGVYLHLYGKHITKPYRKMGHITIIDETIEAAKMKALSIKDIFKVTA